jgi:MFS family permease
MLLLFLAANLYSIDKGIVGVMAEQIRVGLSMSDVQMGLLLGLAYVLLGGILGLGFGYLVDRHIRRTILAISIIVWSFGTAASGFAHGFTSLFICRALVGLGEAAIAPAAISLIADMFPPHRRGRALGSYFIGATIGSALSSIIPGQIIAAQIQLPELGFGPLAPWRSVFVLCGAAGPLIGLLLLTIREPVRQDVRSLRSENAPLRENFAYLWQHRRVIVPLYAGFCLHYVAFVGIIAYTATFLARQYHVTLVDFAGRLGIMVLIAGGAGYVFGSILTDSAPCRLPGGKLVLLSILPLLALPSAMSGLAPHLLTALVMLTGMSFTTPIINVTMNTSLYELLPNRMRGFAYALLSVIVALPAGAGGPFAIAWATQHIIGDPAQIGRAFLIVGAPVLLAASGCFFFAWRGFQRSVRPNNANAAVQFSQA